MSASRSIVIGTAGHIDHGKTTLVRALTGIDADRLPEEKRRGITIDLGFASCELLLPDGTPLRISFVDVPGHADFIRNMLAGAGCVSAVMLVIAANEGVMPQTTEHLAICELLGISHGFTVITKSDAVSSAQLQEVTHSVKTYLQRTFLFAVRSPVLAVSAATGKGLDAVRAELLKLASETQIGYPDALLRLPLDRSFVMRGFGTVVTGTLLSGTIQDGETLQLQPEGRLLRVRGLQTHGESTQSVQPGSRVAVNLANIDAAEVRRGQTLVPPNSISAVDTIDVDLHLLKDAPPLKHRASVHFHAFTSETMASVALYGYEAVPPGGRRLTRLKLSEPIVLIPGDRFVLRQPSPAGTIGGGRILDAHPEPRQRKAATHAWLEELKNCSTSQQIELRVIRRAVKGIALDALSAEMGLEAAAILRHAAPALDSGNLLRIADDLLLSRKGLLEAANAIMLRLQSAQHPVKASELRSQTSLSSDIFDFALKSLVREQEVQLRNETVSIFIAGAPASSADAEQITAVARAYEEAGLTSPTVKELAQSLNLKDADMRRVITALQREKTIVRMGSDDLFIHSTALQRLTTQVAALSRSTLDVGRFKQLTGLSRKYAIPLLEYLDRQRITRKDGDTRIVL